MFTDKLYDHIFDIDDILKALCGDHHKGRWLLNTHTGELIQEPLNKQNENIYNGANNNHWHVIEPLPLSVLKEITHHFTLQHQKEAADITHILNTVSSLQALHIHFYTSPGGGWMRERIKDIALEWLNDHDLIPPSMHCVTTSKSSGTLPTGTSTKIKISMESS